MVERLDREEKNMRNLSKQASKQASNAITLVSNNIFSYCNNIKIKAWYKHVFFAFVKK